MREYLTEKEVDRLIEAAKGNRWGHRDATAILIAYRHGLRASELVALRWSDLELQTGDLAGQGAPQLPVSGSFDVREAFAEIQIPVISHSFIEEFSITGSNERTTILSRALDRLPADCSLDAAAAAIADSRADQ